MGRGTPCNAASVIRGGLVKALRAADRLTLPSPATGTYTASYLRPRPQISDRREVDYVLDIGGTLFEANGSPIERIEVDETSEHMVSRIEIVLSESVPDFAGSNIFEQGKEIKLMLGYRGTGMKRRGNLFYSQGARIRHGASEAGTRHVVIVGYGEEVLLTLTEKRRVWRNLRDSEIAEQIAAEYGWQADVDQTEPIHEHVAQMNESDWKFLDKRARYYGFQVFVDHGPHMTGGPILHFHAPRYRKPMWRLIYGHGQESTLRNATVGQTPLGHGSRVVASQVDPLSREVFTVQSQEKKDEVTEKTEAAARNMQVVSSDKLSVISETIGQGDAFLFEEGHKQTRFSLQDQVEGVSQSTRWLVAGDARTFALEDLRVRDCVELIGIGRDSGEYYIRRLRTEVGKRGFLASFQVTRTWRGGPLGNRFGNKTVELSSAGTVGL